MSGSRGLFAALKEFVDKRRKPPVKLSEELDHIHGLYLFGQHYDTCHGPHTKENPETVFDDPPKETHG